MVRSAEKEERLTSIEEAPSQVPLGLIKVLAITIPFIYGGAMISKRGAQFLEEWNIFVPDDEDD